MTDSQEVQTEAQKKVTDLQEVQKKVGELEELYQEKVTNLHNANNTVVKEEHELLLCLRELMPLQNSYLTSVIKILQAQNEKLKEDNLKLNGGKLETVPDDETEADDDLPPLENVKKSK